MRTEDEILADYQNARKAEVRAGTVAHEARERAAVFLIELELRQAGATTMADVEAVLARLVGKEL